MINCSPCRESKPLPVRAFILKPGIMRSVPTNIKATICARGGEQKFTIGSLSLSSPTSEPAYLLYCSCLQLVTTTIRHHFQFFFFLFSISSFRSHLVATMNYEILALPPPFAHKTHQNSASCLFTWCQSTTPTSRRTQSSLASSETPGIAVCFVLISSLSAWIAGPIAPWLNLQASAARPCD